MILKNAARCKKCGDIIESKYTHDFVRCGCGAIAVDGGRSYLKRSAMSMNDVEELSIVIEDTESDRKDGGNR
jgi:hypothetical protein